MTESFQEGTVVTLFPRAVPDMGLGPPATSALETVVAASLSNCVPPVHSPCSNVSANSHSSNLSLTAQPFTPQAEGGRAVDAVKEIWRKNCGGLDPQQWPEAYCSAGSGSRESGGCTCGQHVQSFRHAGVHTFRSGEKFLRPQSDDLVERFHRILGQQLAILTAQHQQDWDDHLPLVLMA